MNSLYLLVRLGAAYYSRVPAKPGSIPTQGMTQQSPQHLDSEGNLPAQLQGAPRRPFSVWVLLGGAQKPCAQLHSANTTDHQSHMQLSYGKRWIWEVGKPKRNVWSLPWKSKAWAIVTQQAAWPISCLPKYQRSEINSWTSSRSSIRDQALERRPAAQRQHWKQERRQGGHCFKILRENYFQPRILNQAKLAISWVR